MSTIFSKLLPGKQLKHLFKNNQGQIKMTKVFKLILIFAGDILEI